MKFFLSLLLMGVLLPIFCLAQSNYTPGYVVTVKGDTIKGFIDYKEWHYTPTNISFKAALTEVNSKKYTVNDISCFNINDLETYIKYTGPVTTDPTSPFKIGNVRDTSFRTDTVFLKVIGTGKRLTLYSYTDEIKTRYFLSDNTNSFPRELIFRTYFDPNSNTGIGTILENTYQKQLSAEALKYNELNDALITYMSKADYTADDISKIVRRINHSDRSGKSNSGEAKGYQFFAGAGLNITKTLPDGSKQLDESSSAFRSILPAISGGINVFTNPNIRQLILRFEMMFTGGQYKYYNTFNIYQGSFMPQVIYNFYNKPDFKLYGGIGLTIDKYFYSDVRHADLNFNTGFLFDAGIQTGKHWAVYVRYTQNSLSARNTQVGFNYLFK
jgi:hypothetical protein